MDRSMMASQIGYRSVLTGDIRASRQRWAGIAFFALAAQFMTVIMLAASIAPAYDNATGAISDLGVIPSTAALFNVSLIVVGLLNILGGWAYCAGEQRRGLFVVYVVAGIGAIGAGVFPLNTGWPHSLAALLAFIFFNVEAIGTGRHAHGWMRWISVGAGIVGLAFVVLMIVGDAGDASAFGAIGHGGAERMIVYPPMLWMLAFGGYLLGRAESPAMSNGS